MYIFHTFYTPEHTEHRNHNHFSIHLSYSILAYRKFHDITCTKKIDRFNYISLRSKLAITYSHSLALFSIITPAFFEEKKGYVLPFPVHPSRPSS